MWRREIVDLCTYDQVQCAQWQLLRTLYDGSKMVMVLVPKRSIVADSHHKPGQLGEVLWRGGRG